MRRNLPKTAPKRLARPGSCYPGPCSTGWPWPIWTVYGSGIPFAYDETAAWRWNAVSTLPACTAACNYAHQTHAKVQASTKASVQQAIRRLQQMTCVQFTVALSERLRMRSNGRFVAKRRFICKLLFHNKLSGPAGGWPNGKIQVILMMRMQDHQSCFLSFCTMRILDLITTIWHFPGFLSHLFNVRQLLLSF